MVWLVPACALAALLLVAIGAVVLVGEGRALEWKAKSIEPPAVNPYRFRRALEQLQRDVEAAAALADRARIALGQIDAAFKELAESPIARFFRNPES